MLQDAVADELLAEHADGDWVFPAYDSYCFANVNPTAFSVLGVDTDRTLPESVFAGVDTDVDNVVVVLVDGFGYDHWRRDYEHTPFLEEITDCGAVTPLTSVYPSETTAAMSTFHTGQEPIEHGRLGWFSYVPEVDTVLQPLPFTTLNDEPADGAVGATPNLLLNAETCYESASEGGVSSTLVQPAGIANSAFSQLTNRGAEVLPYETTAEMALRIRQTLESVTGLSYISGYVPNIDSVSHEHGTEAPEYQAQLGILADCLRRELVTNLDPETAERTLLVVTADHGHVDTVPEENVDIKTLDGLETHLATDRGGNPIPAVGSPRNVQFHVTDGHLEPLRKLLDSHLDVRTFDRDEAAALGLFGNRAPSMEFERQMPDLVAVHRNRGLWYDDGHLEHVGMHGGLTRAEMLVPFAAVNLGNLRQ